MGDTWGRAVLYIRSVCTDQTFIVGDRSSSILMPLLSPPCVVCSTGGEHTRAPHPADPGGPDPCRCIFKSDAIETRSSHGFTSLPSPIFFQRWGAGL